LLFPRAGYDLNWLFRDKQGRVSEFRATGKYLITNSQSIRQCAQSGMGLALLPDWLISNELNSGSLVKVLTDYEVTATEFDSAVWMLYPSREYLPLKTRVFMDYLVDKLQSDN